jgi:hypothetical protein
MKRGCSAPIPGIRVSSSFDQRRDGERPERGRREMERRIADVQLVRDFLHETFPGDARLRDPGCGSHEPHRPGFVGNDRSKEIGKGRRSIRHDKQSVVSQNHPAHKQPLLWGEPRFITRLISL